MNVGLSLDLYGNGKSIGDLAVRQCYEILLRAEAVPYLVQKIPKLMLCTSAERLYYDRVFQGVFPIFSSILPSALGKAPIEVPTVTPASGVP